VAPRLWVGYSTKLCYRPNLKSIYQS